MYWQPPPSHPLRRLFAGLVEHAFYADLGLCDPQVAAYVSDLLTDFVHVDRIFAMHDERGRPIEDVAAMITDARIEPDCPAHERDRLVHKHIGDFTLFWTGVYPEGLRFLRSPRRRDHLVDYLRQGKRSYAIASDLSADGARPPGPVLRRLSEHFELCVHGLGIVRRGLDALRRRRPDVPTLR